MLTPGQKAKLANVRDERYPTQFAFSLIHKDLRLVLDAAHAAHAASVPMPVTAAGTDADFSAMIGFMERLAALPEGTAEGTAAGGTPVPRYIFRVGTSER